MKPSVCTWGAPCLPADHPFIVALLDIAAEHGAELAVSAGAAPDVTVTIDGAEYLLMCPDLGLVVAGDAEPIIPDKCADGLALAVPCLIWLNDVAVESSTVYLALHHADPGIGGSQTTNEVSNRAYGRLPVGRAEDGTWSIAAGVPDVDAMLVRFAAGRDMDIVTHVSIGVRSAGPSTVLHVMGV